jgi:hypothetical protein
MGMAMQITMHARTCTNTSSETKSIGQGEIRSVDWPGRWWARRDPSRQVKLHHPERPRLHNQNRPGHGSDRNPLPTKDRIEATKQPASTKIRRKSARIEAPEPAGASDSGEQSGRRGKMADSELTWRDGRRRGGRLETMWEGGRDLRETGGKGKKLEMSQRRVAESLWRWDPPTSRTCPRGRGVVLGYTCLSISTWRES